MLLRELDIGHVQEVFQRLFDEGMTAATARRLFSTLRSALGTAVRERLLPYTLAQVPEAAEGAQAVRGGVDEAAGRGVAEDWNGPWWRCGRRRRRRSWSLIAGYPLFAAYHLIAMRGLRRGEACRADVDDLDLDEGLPTSPGSFSRGPAASCGRAR